MPFPNYIIRITALTIDENTSVAVSSLKEADENLSANLNALSKETSVDSEKSEVFNNAISIISSLESSPSCHRLAAASLLQSCRSIQTAREVNDGDKSTSEQLDRMKSIFAARLAVCELDDVNAVIPEQCKAFLVPAPYTKRAPERINIWSSRRHTESKVIESEESAVKEFMNCLEALESRPQWWTSYSNARQNAFVICEATRAETEKCKPETSVKTHPATANMCYSRDFGDT